jgi:hypothetical protein
MEEPLDPRWRKASYSGNGGGSCVEVGTAWRKASYSGNGGGDCVEAGTPPTVCWCGTRRTGTGPC